MLVPVIPAWLEPRVKLDSPKRDTAVFAPRAHTVQKVGLNHINVHLPAYKMNSFSQNQHPKLPHGVKECSLIPNSAKNLNGKVVTYTVFF